MIFIWKDLFFHLFFKTIERNKTNTTHTHDFIFCTLFSFQTLSLKMKHIKSHPSFSFPFFYFSSLVLLHLKHYLLIFCVSFLNKFQLFFWWINRIHFFHWLLFGWFELCYCVGTDLTKKSDGTISFLHCITSLKRHLRIIMIFTSSFSWTFFYAKLTSAKIAKYLEIERVYEKIKQEYSRWRMVLIKCLYGNIQPDFHGIQIEMHIFNSNAIQFNSPINARFSNEFGNGWRSTNFVSWAHEIMIVHLNFRRHFNDQVWDFIEVSIQSTRLSFQMQIHFRNWACDSSVYLFCFDS